MSLIRKGQTLFVRFVTAIEQHPAPLGSFVRLFFALLTIRLALEFVSSRRLFTFADIVHIGLWFCFIVLAFLLQLHLFSREPIARLSKLVIVCYSVAWSAPIVDLLVTGGQGARMNYLSINSWRDAVAAYFTVGGASLWRGATPGIRLEIIGLVLASANYVHTKTGSALRAIVSAVSIYTVLFASGAIPALLGQLVRAFALTYEPDDQSTLLLLLLANVLLLAAILWRHAPDTFSRVRRAVRVDAVLLALAHVSLGVWLAHDAYPSNVSLNPTTIFWFPLAVLLLLALASFAAAASLEDERASSAAHVSVFVTLAIGLSLSARVFFGAAIAWALLLLAHDAPARLARVPVLAALLFVLLMLAALTTGFMAGGGPLIGLPPLLALGVVVANGLVFRFRARVTGRAR